AVEPVAQDKPRKFLVVRHRRTRCELDDRYANSSRDGDAGFDCKVFPQRDDIEPRVVQGAVEIKLSMIDHKPLTKGRVGTVDGGYASETGKLAIGRRLDAHLARETRIESLADEREVIAEVEFEIDIERNA